MNNRRVVIGIFVSFILIYLIIWIPRPGGLFKGELSIFQAAFGQPRIDFTNLGRILLHLKPIPLILGFLVTPIHCLVRSHRWGIMVKHMSKLKLFDGFSIIMVSYFTNSILPLRIGEVVRGVLLGRRIKITNSAGLGTVALDRALDMVSLQHITDRSVYDLSGGEKARLALAKLILTEPSFLVLDEPTNHLDIAGIDWLEQLLVRARGGFVIISHDRYFLEHVTNRIVEIDSRYTTGVFSVNAPYSVFLTKRKALLQIEKERQHVLASVVKQEVDWLRRGPKARGTKASSRINAAWNKIEHLNALQQRQGREGELQIGFNARNRRTHNLIIAQGVSKTLGGR